MQFDVKAKNKFIHSIGERESEMFIFITSKLVQSDVYYSKFYKKGLRREKGIRMIFFFY